MGFSPIICNDIGSFDRVSLLKFFFSYFRGLRNQNLRTPWFNLLVTRCFNKFNIQQLYVLPTLYLCVV
jgi:hypothetical protein